MTTTTTNPNIVIRNINNYTDLSICPSMDRATKLIAVESAINSSKYNVVGLVDRTNHVILETRFHNVRDNKGRFARVVGNRRSR
jgi:hypothetical protein